MAKGPGTDKAGRTGYWKAIDKPSESALPEGTGLMWLQEEMPSWRWYVEQARDSMP